MKSAVTIEAECLDMYSEPRKGSRCEVTFSEDAEDVAPRVHVAVTTWNETLNDEEKTDITSLEMSGKLTLSDLRALGLQLLAMAGGA